MTGASEAPADVRAFLIADVRGYTLFTAERGDEDAAKLAARFAQVAREGVEARSGTVLELRGDEALCVFASPRQAIRAAVDLQRRFAEETEADPSLPLPIGIGLDAGEAVPLEGGYRGGALNLAARLCGQAGPGEILASSEIVHLAGHVEGIAYVDRGQTTLKGLAEPVRVISVFTGHASSAPGRTPVAPGPPRFGASSRRRGRLLLVGVLLAAAAAGGVWLVAAAQRGEPPVSPSGTAAVLSSTPVPQLVILDAESKEAESLTTSTGADTQPSWNGDGSRVAFVRELDEDKEIFVVNADGSGTAQQLTINNVEDAGPDWSPTDVLIFTSDRDDRETAIYTMTSQGEEERPLFDAVGHDGGAVWSSDGTKIAFSSEAGGTADIWIMDVDGHNAVRLTDTPADDTTPAWSPDRRMIAFTRDVGGTVHVYVIPVDRSADAVQLSTPQAGGQNPTWSPDGMTIAYIGTRPGNQDLYTVRADGSGQPRRLTTSDGDERDPDWEPVLGGTRIAYAYVADPETPTTSPV